MVMEAAVKEMGCAQRVLEQAVAAWDSQVWTEMGEMLVAARVVAGRWETEVMDAAAPSAAKAAAEVEAELAARREVAVVAASEARAPPVRAAVGAEAQAADLALAATVAAARVVAKKVWGGRVACKCRRRTSNRLGPGRGASTCTLRKTMAARQSRSSPAPLRFY